MTDDNEQWFEREELWEKLRPYIFPADRWEAAPGEVDDLVDLLELGDESRILDLPCGPGRHAVEFAARGFDVTGVDITPQYTEEATQLAAERGVDAEFVVSDMRDFSRPESFDVVLNLFSSFGYFEDPGQDLVLLESMRENLRPGGHLVLEMVAKESLVQRFTPHDWHEFEDGAFLLEEREVRDDWGAIDNRWILIETDGTRTEYELSHRLFGASELRRLVEDAGFVDARVYGSLAGEDFDPDDSRLVLTARRSS